MIAFAKLQELISGPADHVPGPEGRERGVCSRRSSGSAIAIVAGAEHQWLLWLLIAGALVFGVLFVLPIGGADMPVVISLLNAFTGLAAAATGFELTTTC